MGMCLENNPQSKWFEKWHESIKIQCLYLSTFGRKLKEIKAKQVLPKSLQATMK